MLYFINKYSCVNSNIRIGVAGAVGILLILGAFYVSKNTTAQTQKSTGSIIAQKLLRESIEVKDDNNNGVPDWKEGLGGATFNTITAPSSTSPYAFDVKPYTPPTTLTGKFSEAFLQDYLQGKMQGKDFKDPTAFVNTAVKAIDTSTQSKKHTRAELILIPTTDESLRTYGNEIAGITQKNSTKSDPEMVILQEALQKNDPTILDKLKPIHDGYTQIIADTRVVRVPDTLAVAHVELLNAYEAILTDIIAMQMSFDDPLLALARVRNYEHDTQSLYDALKKIADVFTQNNIQYNQTEPGAFFYIFDAS